MRCLIIGNFGAMNYGDEAILAGELEELKKVPGLTVVVAARFPNEVKRIHGVEAVSLYSLQRVVAEVQNSDFVIVGGGGIINKFERGLFGLAYQLYMLVICFQAPRIYKKKIYALGLGVYSNAHPFIKRITTSMLRNSQMTTVRDYHSYDYLKSKNINARLYKDNSYSMKILPAEKVREDKYFKKYYKNNKINVAISLVKPDSKKEEKHLLNQISTFIENNYPIADFWFYSSDYNPSYINDEKFGHKLHEILKKKLGKKAKFNFIPTDWHPQKFFSSLKLMDFVVTMRFHTTLFTYRNNIDFLGITYDTKCTSLLQSIGKNPLSVKNLHWEDLQKSFARS